MKKKQIFLKTIVAITLLSAMLVSAFLGTSNAEYFKSLNKTLSLEMKPDLNLSYHLRHYPSLNGTRNNENGTYKDSKKFTQEICVGKTALISGSDQTSNTYVYAKADWYQNDKTKYTGDNIIYQIKIPVDETGYYTLDFAVDFWKDGEDQTKEFYTITYDRAVGCEIVNHDEGINFGADGSYLDLYTRSNNDAVYTETGKATKENINRLETDGTYQWKTLCPSRQEYVSLSFKVDADDVKQGYVIWAWDFAGLYGPQKYILECTDISVEKVMNLDGTTDTRDSDDPYFMFPQTDLVNNQLVLSLTNYKNVEDFDFLDGTQVRGVKHKGKTSYSQGRGTFATSATANSLQIQAESLYYGCNADTSKPLTASDGDYSNPLAFYVPVKKVKPGVTYKVTFDLSIARQGDYTVNGFTATDSKGTEVLHRKDMTTEYYANYATYTNMFKSGTNVFSSYLYAGVSGHDQTAVPTNRALSHHQDHGMTAISYNNKAYNGKYLYKDINGNEQTGYATLTKYDEITSLNSINNSTCTSVNDTYAIEQIMGGDRSETRNWYNAIQNIEYNGQNKINWLTFYNTTFSFNIDDAKSKGLNIDENGYITNLEWAWVIDSVIPMSYYRIRLDNVRIQEVVEYSSSLDRNGVIISGYKLTTQYVDNGHTDLETDDVDTHGTDDQSKWSWYKGLFVSYRGTNGTGQNFQSKGAVLDRKTKPQNSQIFTTEGNIYAPIVDAKKINVAGDGADAYKIVISGYAVCKGGIDRYVFSIDGGKTWHDMTLEGIDTDARNASGDLSNAGRGVNQYSSGQTRYYKDGTHNNENEFDWSTGDKYRPTYEKCTHIEFTEADAANGNFHGIVNSREQDPDPDMGWSLVADLSEFKHQANLDVIIAAVPESNHDLRCEIVRIINYNQIQKYYTHAQNIVSDITVTDKNHGESQLNAFYFHTDKKNDECENLQDFTNLKGYRADGKVQAQIGSYSNRLLRSNAYEDVPALFSDIPIYKELSITGVAVAEKGIEGFYWTVDDGKTWYPCGTVSGKVYGETKTDTGSASSMREGYTQWTGDTYDSTKGIAFNKWGDKQFKSYIRANLSAYEGQVVDVLYAAKPFGSDVYVPVAKVDNVAVYGEQGTFYTRVHKVVIDGRTNGTPAGIQTSGLTQTPANSSGTNLNYWNKWNLEYSNQAYVIFEPQNVNAANARYITNVVQEIESAGRVAIDGYIMCKGGVSRYKFSLDGGETWTVINDKAGDMSALAATHDMIKYSQRSDTSFDPAKDGKNGDFCCTGLTGGATPDTSDTATRKKFYDHALEFNIPALPQGAERDLLVVAEHDPDGNPYTDDGKEFPVLHMKIRVKNTKYGYQNITRNADLTKLNVQAGYYSDTNTLTFNPDITNKATGEHKTLNRITIPVTETGEHTLSFEHIIHNDQSIDSKTTKQLYNASGAANKNDAGTLTKADITLKANKTHYLEEESITVSVDMSKTTESNPGILKVVVVSEDWLNNHGNQHAIYAETITMNWEYNDETEKWSASWSLGNIRSLAYANQGLQTDEQKLKAGKYKIMLLNRVGGEKGIKVKGTNDNMTVRDFLHYKDLRDKFLLAEIPIYIHAADEKVDFSLVHDEGKYTYFSDVSRQLTGGYDNVDTIATLSAAELFGTPGTVAKKITVNVTEGDVRRGYIILDTNYTGLWAGNEHTDECINKPIEEGYGTNWGEHESNTTCTDKTHKHYAGHKHSNNTCLSRQEGNPTHFNKQIKGENLYELTKLYYDDENTAPKTIIKHTGIDYQVTFNFIAFVKET